MGLTRPFIRAGVGACVTPIPLPHGVGPTAYVRRRPQPIRAVERLSIMALLDGDGRIYDPPRLPLRAGISLSLSLSLASICNFSTAASSMGRLGGRASAAQ